VAKRVSRGGEQVASVKAASVETQIDGFLAKYSPEMEKLARACWNKMRALLPGSTEIVYDNYNALAVGFGPSEKASEAIFSLAFYTRWVNLFFLQGAQLNDPHRLLKGDGSRVRSIQLSAAADLDQPEVRDLIATALMDARKTIDPKGKGRVTIRAIAEKQRPRRSISKPGVH